MKYSVIIPTYNVEKYITRCIQSILDCKYDEMEIICVDDCSSDRTELIVRELERADCRIHLLVNEENRGPSYSRHRGAEMATGDYLLFVDSDDYVLDTMFSCFEKAVMGEPELVYSNGNYEFIESSSYSLVNEAVAIDCESIISGIELLRLFMSNGISGWSMWGKAYRRDFWKSLPRFSNKESMEDLEAGYKIIERAKTVSIAEPFYCYYRGRKGSILTTLSYRKLVNYVDVLTGWKEYLLTDQLLPEDLKDSIMRQFNDEYCSAVLAKTYWLEGEERKKILEKAKKIHYYLEYPSGGKNKLVAISVKVIGFNNTCRLLSMIKRIKYYDY